ncbi:uncharacterized protein LOC130792047 isoform X2 [Actinidia eriantha]|uniref:uncharacterized protein LOC130792047 isoform X2 n=1 Tax=Actinidia eriantha TaxID=165200 RepID=UPI00258809F1|nr:uncharacterized protein LOC130792047 isoform X2 [Actinidia eriantha]
MVLRFNSYLRNCSRSSVIEEFGRTKHASQSIRWPCAIIIRFLSGIVWDIMSILGNHPCTWSIGGWKHSFKGRFSKLPCFGYYNPDFYFKESFLLPCQYIAIGCKRSIRMCQPIFSSIMDNGADPDDSSEGIDDDESSEGESEDVNCEMLRENLERIVGKDDSAFSGIDLATLIRKKYGKSYDVQLIKKDFMGRNLLALNVMWKYMEQKSFPLTEEEYLLRLDDVANTLKCWGAVSHIRNSLANSKERPRIGKGVRMM